MGPTDPSSPSLGGPSRRDAFEESRPSRDSADSADSADSVMTGDQASGLAPAQRLPFAPGLGGLEALPNPNRLRYMPGETIVRQGESADAVLRLLSGRVMARTIPGEDAVPDDDAIERRARPVGIDKDSGDMPAESGALVEDRACSLVAVTEVELETVPAAPERLERMIAEEPGLGLALAEDLGRKLLRTTHGITLVDGRLSELGREVDRHEAAFDRLLKELLANDG